MDEAAVGACALAGGMGSSGNNSEAVSCEPNSVLAPDKEFAEDANEEDEVIKGDAVAGRVSQDPRLNVYEVSHLRHALLKCCAE